MNKQLKVRFLLKMLAVVVVVFLSGNINAMDPHNFSFFGPGKQASQTKEYSLFGQDKIKENDSILAILQEGITLKLYDFLSLYLEEYLSFSLLKDRLENLSETHFYNENNKKVAITLRIKYKTDRALFIIPYKDQILVEFVDLQQKNIPLALAYKTSEYKDIADFFN